MKSPYSVAELDALIRACIEFTDDYAPDFAVGNIGGRDEVGVDIDANQRMLEWVAELDKGLIENRGFGLHNINYFRLGHDARQMMKGGGFEKYFRRRERKVSWINTHKWAPIGISILLLLAAIAGLYISK